MKLDFEMVLLLHHQISPNQEEYLNYSDILLAATELSEGRHQFPFSVPLESNIPSSFEGQHGHVRYKVTATIDDPGKKSHPLFLNVLTPYDLNKNEDAQVCVLKLVLSFF